MHACIIYKHPILLNSVNCKIKSLITCEQDFLQHNAISNFLFSSEGSNIIPSLIFF